MKSCSGLKTKLVKLMKSEWLGRRRTAQEAEMSDVEVAAELLEHLSCIKTKAASIQTEIICHIELEELWDVMEELLNSYKQYLRKLHFAVVF